MSIGGALRNIIRPLSARRLLPLALPSPHGISSPMTIASTSSNLLNSLGSPMWKSLIPAFLSTYSPAASFSDLMDSRFSKRRPGIKPRRKRASLKPPGPYAWVQYVPGEPIPRSRPNAGSDKARGRNRIKRIKQRKAFILSEKKKRKAQYAEFRKKRDIERIERKMAAVAREKAWAERLIELQQQEEAKKAAMV
ncbi:hypothetical protein J5N97_006036 [Dioscorea zingiberensis]|uniref:Uncharacterized protein n=1 Tax=Dioscorea zingiberensis TaxID=325984 RepID=A0A9D5D997_9LILI|nr:hypothetical protein J5N97_006036 [Dioscorea zingiberensis]